MTPFKKSLGIDLLIGTVIAAGVYVLNSSRGFEVTKCICDAFFVAAAVLLSVGGITSARNHGTFDVMTYSITSVFKLHLPGSYSLEDRENINEYIERKQKKRKPATALLIAGLIYLVLSLAALAVYYAV